MRVGIHLPQWGPAATRDGVTAVARTIEEAGLDSAWVADHVVVPAQQGEDYPYAERLPFKPEEGILEALAVLAFAAAATTRIRLGTSILVLPMRQTVMTAKVLATLDVLSGGRLAVGVGAGWWKAEFDALDAAFARRGDHLDEQIAALRALWNEGTAAFAGSSVSFERLTCEPRPPQGARLPILVGGTGERALRRAGTLGDGWHATGAHAEGLAANHAKVRAFAERAGRDPESVPMSTSAVIPSDRDEALRRLDRLASAGVSELVLSLPPGDAAQACASIERFAAGPLAAWRAGSGS
jgi:probable F420-dependent oxidoreductase